MSTSHIVSATDLYKALAQECELGMALVDLLFEEQASLVKLDVAHLQELALKKEAMMLELEKRYQNNVQLARANGFEANFDGLSDWVERLAPQEKNLQVTFYTLKSTLLQAQRINETNGEIVAEQMAGLQERISILTAAALQEQSGGASDTYSAKGAMQQRAGKAGATPRAVIR